MGKPVTSSLNLAVNTYTFGKFGKGPPEIGEQIASQGEPLRLARRFAMAWRSSSEACRNGRRSRGAWHCSWGGERVGNMVPMKVWKLVKPPTMSLVGFLFHEVSCCLLHLVTGCSCAVSISSLTPIQHPAEACCGPTLFKVLFGFLLKQVSKVILVLLTAGLLHHFGCISPSKLDRGAHSQLVARFHPTW